MTESERPLNSDFHAEADDVVIHNEALHKQYNGSDEKQHDGDCDNDDSIQSIEIPLHSLDESASGASLIFSPDYGKFTLPEFLSPPRPRLNSVPHTQTYNTTSLSGMNRPRLHTSPTRLHTSIRQLSSGQSLFHSPLQHFSKKSLSLSFDDKLQQSKFISASQRFYYDEDDETLIPLPPPPPPAIPFTIISHSQDQVDITPATPHEQTSIEYEQEESADAGEDSKIFQILRTPRSNLAYLAYQDHETTPRSSHNLQIPPKSSQRVGHFEDGMSGTYALAETPKRTTQRIEDFDANLGSNKLSLEKATLNDVQSENGGESRLVDQRKQNQEKTLSDSSSGSPRVVRFTMSTYQHYNQEIDDYDDDHYYDEDSWHAPQGIPPFFEDEREAADDDIDDQATPKSPHVQKLYPKGSGRTTTITRQSTKSSWCYNMWNCILYKVCCGVADQVASLSYTPDEESEEHHDSESSNSPPRSKSKFHRLEIRKSFINSQSGGISWTRVSYFVVTYAPCFWLAPRMDVNTTTDRLTAKRLNLLGIFFSLLQIGMGIFCAVVFTWTKHEGTTEQEESLDRDTYVSPNLWNPVSSIFLMGLTGAILCLAFLDNLWTVHDAHLTRLMRFYWTVRWILPIELIGAIGLFDYHGVTRVWVTHWWTTPAFSWFRNRYCPIGTAEGKCSPPQLLNEQSITDWCIENYNGSTDCYEIQVTAQNKMIRDFLIAFVFGFIGGLMLCFEASATFLLIFIISPIHKTYSTFFLIMSAVSSIAKFGEHRNPPCYSKIQRAKYSCLVNIAYNR